MKIGIDVRLWNETGVGRYIRNLVIELAKLDRENQYALFALSKDYKNIQSLVPSSQFTVITVDIRWHSAREQVEFPRLLNKYSLDLVHFPYFSIPVFYKKPYVVTVHDLIVNNFPTGRASTLPFPFYRLKKFGYDYVMKHSISDSKKIITPSQATKDEIVKFYKTKKEKIVVTPEGVDDGFTDFAPTIFKNQRPYFLYVGNAYPHKNLEKLIGSFDLFSKSHPEFMLVLVGKKDHFYQKIEKKYERENIVFKGYVEDEELAKLYLNSAATFIPSLMEGFGLTALEAMKMGSIVACSSIPSLKEVCGDSAVYFEPNDILSMVKSMEEIIGMPKDKKKDKISEGKRHTEKYSWAITAKLTLEVYNSCL